MNPKPIRFKQVNNMKRYHPCQFVTGMIVSDRSISGLQCIRLGALSYGRPYQSNSTSIDLRKKSGSLRLNISILTFRSSQTTQQGPGFPGKLSHLLGLDRSRTVHASVEWSMEVKYGSLRCSLPSTVFIEICYENRRM